MQVAQLNMGTKELHMASNVIKPHSDSQEVSQASPYSNSQAASQVGVSKIENALTMSGMTSSGGILFFLPM